MCVTLCASVWIRNVTAFIVLQVVVQVANTSNFICEHQGFLPPELL